jgi:hypothetical protein
MKSEVKIILYPEEYKSKNGSFFEDLMRSIFERQGYQIKQNINFTGLEIDLLAKHIDRKETLLIECKAKNKPRSTELKNFAFNVIDKEADYGYFVYTEELDHQAAGLVEEWSAKERYKKLSFFGPEKIISSLENTGKVFHLDLSEIEKNETINKKILAYTYFGVFYIIIPFTGTAQKFYYLFDKNGKQVEDANTIADKRHSGNLSIDNALKKGIAELKKIDHRIFSLKKIEAKQQEKTKVAVTKEIFKIAVLSPSPIDSEIDLPVRAVKKEIEKLNLLIDYYFLTLSNLQDIEGYDYVIIISEVYKNKILIENKYLCKKYIPFLEIEDNYINDAKLVLLITKGNLDLIETKIPVLHLFHEENNKISKLINSIFFKILKKGLGLNEIKNDNVEIYNLNEFRLKKFEKGDVIINEQSTPLPSELDNNKFHGFIGRKTDQENIIRKIIEVSDSKKVLNIKGSGGIGKTTIISKVVYELSLRGAFKQGISFVACEYIESAKSFEAQIARCFKLDNIINLKEHLNEVFSEQDALIILDNFETLLTLENKKEVEEIKRLVQIISDYATIVITSRETKKFDFEEVYLLDSLTTDEALELFQLHCKIKLRNDKEEKILREDIIENLLNKNPLAIKLIARNSFNYKDVNLLKKELDTDFGIFEKSIDSDIEEIFDRDADVNIERKKSLYQSIYYSYEKLNGKQRLALELLHLFPDGITHSNFKKCFIKQDRRGKNITDTSTMIDDRDINTLENKSLVENNSGTIKLQSIIGRFAKYQFEKREKEEKSKYYQDAYSYNAYILLVLKHFDYNQQQQLAYEIFDKYSNNLISALKYLDKVEQNKRLLLNYTNDLANHILSEAATIQYLKNIDKIKGFFDDLEFAKDYLRTRELSFVYYHKIFEGPYNEIKEKYPVQQVVNEIIEDKEKEELKLDYLFRAFSIHNYEGRTVEFVKWLQNNVYYDWKEISTAIFYLGNYDYIDDDTDFYKFEKDLILNTIDKTLLKDYIAGLFKKDHLERLQCTYVLSKIERVEEDTIKKLVVTNPYSRGLKFLMFAFIEESQSKKVELFEEAIDNLEHIKYYYIEAIFYFSKYLKEINHPQYKNWFEKGYSLADKFYYRHQLHRFLCLKNGTNNQYNAKDYSLPKDINLYDFVIQYNKVWANIDSKKEPIKDTQAIAPAMPKVLYVEGKTDKKILKQAIFLYSKKLDDLIIKTDDSSDGAGTDWVRKSILSFATKPDKDKGKAIAILDFDEAGIEAHKKIIDNDDFKKDAQKNNVKTLLIGKEKPSHLIKLYKNGVLSKHSNYGIAIENFFPLKYWLIAKEKGWLEEIKDISQYHLQNSPDEPARNYILRKGLSEDELVFLLYKFSNDYKNTFANFICGLDKREQEVVFREFQSIIKNLEDFFEK